jgi:hypothetical protein
MFYLYDDSGDGGVKAGGGDGGDGRLEGEIWVDWEFVEFWKGNCCMCRFLISLLAFSITLFP